MDYGDFVIEKEISYSINFSQDLLYKILNSYIVPNYSLAQQYFDLYDENGFRTRICDQTRFVNYTRGAISKPQFLRVDLQVLGRYCASNQILQKSTVIVK